MALSPIEIFIVGFLPVRIEEDLIGGELAEQMADTPELAGARAAFLEAFAGSAQRRANDFVLIEATLNKHGFSVPPRPTNSADLARWRAGLASSLAGADEKPIAGVVVPIADAWLALNLGALLAPLNDRAPSQEAVKMRIFTLAGRRIAAIRALTAAVGEVKDSTVAQVTRDILNVLNDRDSLNGDNDRLRAWAQTLGRMVDALQVALLDASGPAKPAS